MFLSNSWPIRLGSAPIHRPSPVSIPAACLPCRASCVRGGRARDGPVAEPADRPRQRHGHLLGRKLVEHNAKRRPGVLTQKNTGKKVPKVSLQPHTKGNHMKNCLVCVDVFWQEGFIYPLVGDLSLGMMGWLRSPQTVQFNDVLLDLLHVATKFWWCSCIATVCSQ